GPGFLPVDVVCANSIAGTSVECGKLRRQTAAENRATCITAGRKAGQAGLHLCISNTLHNLLHLSLCEPLGDVVRCGLLCTCRCCVCATKCRVRHVSMTRSWKNDKPDDRRRKDDRPMTIGPATTPVGQWWRGRGAAGLALPRV